MQQVGNGLHEAGHHAEALSVKEAELAMARRLGASEHDILVAQGNLANTYQQLGRLEEALIIRREVHSGCIKHIGEEHALTLHAANNYAASLLLLKRFEEAKALMRKTMPIARRVLGEGSEMCLGMRMNYARVLCQAEGATLDDLREAVTALEETERTARRVLGGAHPLTEGIEESLRDARAALRARETPSSA